MIKRKKPRRAAPKGFHEWMVFLPIPAPNTTDMASGVDPFWCEAKGVYFGADVVLRLLRDEVSPLIRNSKVNEGRKGLVGFHFLIHDRNSGVPTTPDDHGAYIHLRLRFALPQTEKAMRLALRLYPKFVMPTPVTTTQTAIGGIDLRLIKGNEDARVRVVNRLLDAQSAWVLQLIDAHQWSDDALMIRQVKQIGHWLSNMLQMRFA